MLNLYRTHIWTLRSSFISIRHESLQLTWTFQELQKIRTHFHSTTVFLQNFTSFSQKTGKGVDFSWTSWFRNAAASFHVPIVSLRWGLEVLAGLDLPKHSILYHTPIAVVCYGREKLLAYKPALITQNNLTHRHMILNHAYSRPKVWGICWTSCIMSYLHVHSGCFCRNWK